MTIACPVEAWSRRSLRGDHQTMSSTSPLSATAAKVLVSRNPADDGSVGEFPVHTAEDIAAMVNTARKAGRWWRQQGFQGRGRVLAAWRRDLWQHADELADLLHRENGKTLDDATLEVVLTVEHLHWAEKNAQKALASRRVSPGVLFANFTATVDYEPYGVVGVISPWNYPLYSPNSSVAYALAAGNAVLLKPSEFTPAVATFYVEAFARANPTVPSGILQVVTGFAETGAALCNSGVGKIGFTGSTKTGQKIMAQCAETLTPVLLECGGKDPVIVAADADLQSAAEAVAWGAFANAGQTCVGVERVYVERSVSERFLELLGKQLDGVTPGSGRGATYGPMTMPAQIDVVRRHVQAAVDAGAELRVGDLASVGDRFIGPVVIVDAPEDTTAVREETFGPIVTVRTVDSLDEAVELANDHEYALSASVFSRRHADSIARRLRAGQVSVDSVIAFAGMGGVPMGGVGASGFGRVHGVDGLREFVYPRSHVRKRFGLPAFEVISLHRARHVLPLMRKLLDVRHG